MRLVDYLSRNPDGDASIMSILDNILLLRKLGVLIDYDNRRRSVAK